MNRRDILKLSLAAGGAGVLARSAPAQDGREKGAELLKYLCPPDGFPDQLSRPSPKADPFVQKLERAAGQDPGRKAQPAARPECAPALQ